MRASFPWASAAARIGPYGSGHGQHRLDRARSGDWGDVPVVDDATGLRQILGPRVDRDQGARVIRLLADRVRAEACTWPIHGAGIERHTKNDEIRSLEVLRALGPVEGDDAAERKPVTRQKGWGRLH
jgi:hypothetical protein